MNGVRKRVVIGVLAAMAVFVALVYASYRSDLAQARARIAANAQVVDTPCGRIEYAVAGEGAPLLVVHGAGGGFDQGLDFVEPLARDGFRVIAVSRFGYLGTPLPADASAQAQARAHACLLDALKVEKAAIFGGSAGAPSALQFALLYPDRATRLVLAVPAAYVPRPGDAPSLKSPSETPLVFDTALRSDFLFWAAIHATPRLMMRAILATPPEVIAAASPAEKARIERVFNHILPVSPRRLGLVNDAAITSSLPRYELEKIGVPTLVISAADDLFGTFDSARYTAEQIPGARFVGYDTGGHLLVGRQEEQLSELVAFLRSEGSG